MESIIKSRIPGWLSQDEVSQLLNIKTTAIWKLRQSGKIKTSKIGKYVYYNVKSIMDLIEENAQ